MVAKITARNPALGEDYNAWGDRLNDFLDQARDAVSTLADLVDTGRLSSSQLAALVGDKVMAEIGNVEQGGVTDSFLAGRIGDPASLSAGILRTLYADTWVSNYVTETLFPRIVTDMPTVTGSDTSNAGTLPVLIRPAVVGTGAGVTDWDGKSDTNFRFWPGRFTTANGANGDLALYGQTKPGGASQAALWPTVFAFTTPATNREFEIVGYSKGGSAYQIEVDGTMLHNAGGTVRNGAGSYTLKFTFRVAKARTIRIYSDGSFGLTGVRLPDGQALTKPAAPKNTIAVIGDSYIGGASGVGQLETFGALLVRLLGGSTAAGMLAGIGGSGLTTGTTAYSTRASIVLSENPDTVIIYGSQNDANSTAAATALTSLLATLDSVPRVIVIPTVHANYVTQVNAIRTATLNAGREFADVRGWLTGTGSIAAPAGDGNRDYLLFSDADPHMNHRGHEALAAAVFRSLLTGKATA